MLDDVLDKTVFAIAVCTAWRSSSAPMGAPARRAGFFDFLDK
jgi:hypothetical protein